MYWVSQLRGCNSPLISIVVTRMQGLAAEYSKIFSGVIPPDPYTQQPTRPLAGVGTQTLVPLNFSAVVAPLTQTR